ncbi:hypothetical protein CU048_15800 [Beijerinckiaceae bacterium]|nr:hypothetical protein CU048_15800 [Beijerinckiaceae bacterium]
MEDLIARVAAAASIEPETARKAVGFILAFLRKEGPKEEVDALFAAVPGSAELADAAAAEAGDGGMLGSLMGAMGGGLMGLAGRLTGLGLGMSEMQTIGRQVFAFAREKAGDERVGQVAAAIPGLAQFL